MEITLSRGAAFLTEQGSRAEGAAAVAAPAERFGCCCWEKARKEGKVKKLLSSPTCLPKHLHKLGIALSGSVFWEWYHMG